jgi:hydroxymethylpyrimidine/phosphomethylpyrimidine kinase
MKKSLTIAGSDPSGGAGIQADLKTFAALGVHGMAVVASLTAQNSLGVQGCYDISPEFVERQIDSIVSDMGADSVKTGMLANAGIVRSVAKKVRKGQLGQLVVDPVMLSKNGAVLMDGEGREAMVEFLLPLAFLVTPNVPEAEALANMKIKGVKDMEKAARVIKKMGPANVLVKGGHLDRNATDVLYDGRSFVHFSQDWVETRNTHGTGCTLSAAIAAGLAKGKLLREAVQEAKEYLQIALRKSFSIGKGIGPVHHLADLYRKAEERRILIELESALQILKDAKIGSLVPEVQSNLAAALPDASTHGEVAAFPGRIIRDGQGIAVLHSPAFGASRHIANIVLTNMRYDPSKRACMNIRYGEDVIRCCRKLGLSVSSFDRAMEPAKFQNKEGSTLEWGVREAIERKRGKVPEVIYDKGGLGKEAMVRISSESPLEVVRLVAKISSLIF